MAGRSISQGDHVRVHAAGLFTVVDATYEKGRTLGDHIHGEALLSFAPFGQYDEMVEGARQTCERGTYLLKPAGIRHANRFDRQQTRCISIVIPTAAGDSFPALRRLLTVPRSITGEAAMFQPTIVAELRRVDDLSPLSLQGVVSETLAAIARCSETATSGSFRRARDFIYAHLPQSLTTDDIAAAAGVHSGHLNRLFRRYTGVSTADYVRRLRVEQAANDLALTRLPIADIATRHGFYDQSHLTNAFRRYIGRSPAAYRRDSQK